MDSPPSQPLHDNCQNIIFPSVRSMWLSPSSHMSLAQRGEEWVRIAVSRGVLLAAYQVETKLAEGISLLTCQKHLIFSILPEPV